MIIPRQLYTTSHTGFFSQYIHFLMADVHNLRLDDDKKEKLFNLFSEADRIIKDYPLNQNENSL